MSLRDIKELEEQIEALGGLPQTAPKEREKARLEFQLRIKRAEREIEVARKALFLFNVFWENGTMRVERPPSYVVNPAVSPDYSKPLRLAVQTYSGEPHHVSDVQKVWNARGEADNFASWSTP